MPKNRKSYRQVVDFDITTSSSEASVASQSVGTSPPLLDELVDKMKQLQSPSRPGPEAQEKERVVEIETTSSSSSPVPVPVTRSNYGQFEIRIRRLGRKRQVICSSASSSSSSSGPNSSPSPKWIGKSFTTAVYPPVSQKAAPAREGSRGKIQYTMPSWNSQINPAEKSKSTQTLIESVKLEKFSRRAPSSVMDLPVTVKSPPLIKLQSGTRSKNVAGVRSDGKIVKKTKTTIMSKVFTPGRDSLLQSSSASSLRNSKISSPTKLHQPTPTPSSTKDTTNSTLNSRTATAGRNRKRKGSVNDNKSGDEIMNKKKKKMTSKSGVEKAFKMRTALDHDHEDTTTKKKIIPKIIDISSSDSGFLDSPPPTFKALSSSPSPLPKSLIRPRPKKYYYESGSDSEDSAK